MIDQLYAIAFKNVKVGADADWPTALADWIRHNDDVVLKSTAKVLSTFQDDLLPATSVDEIVDVCGLGDEIPNPTNFLVDILANVP